MRAVTIVRSLLVRSVFICHGLVTVWHLYDVTEELKYWGLVLTIILLLFETVIIIVKKHGKEWKWFCPSVFFYLMSVVPSIWLLELDAMNKRIEKCVNATDIYKCDVEMGEGNKTSLNADIFKNLKLTPDEWIRTLEQLLLLILIICRWLMPKGKLTHDQLSQLLLVYIGTAADIVEFFDFKEVQVKYNRNLCFGILSIWSVSLIQFCLVLTAAKARQDKTGLLRRGNPKNDQKVQCCHADVFAILISILMQDAPFLAFRLLLIFKYTVRSYTNMFFTSKNTIVISLLIYRLVVVYIQRRKSHVPEISLPYDCRSSYLENAEQAAGSDASSIRSQLINRNSFLGDKDGTISLHRLNGCNTERSTGLLKSLPRT